MEYIEGIHRRIKFYRRNRIGIRYTLYRPPQRQGHPNTDFFNFLIYLSLIHLSQSQYI